MVIKINKQDYRLIHHALAEMISKLLEKKDSKLLRLYCELKERI